MSQGFQTIITNQSGLPIQATLSSQDSSWNTAPAWDGSLDSGAQSDEFYSEVSGWSNNATATLNFGPEGGTLSGQADLLYDDKGSVAFANGSVYIMSFNSAPAGSTDQANTYIYPYIEQSATGGSYNWTVATINFIVVENPQPIPAPPE